MKQLLFIFALCAPLALAQEAPDLAKITEDQNNKLPIFQNALEADLGVQLKLMADAKMTECRLIQFWPEFYKPNGAFDRKVYPPFFQDVRGKQAAGAPVNAKNQLELNFPLIVNWDLTPFGQELMRFSDEKNWKWWLILHDQAEGVDLQREWDDKKGVWGAWQNLQPLRDKFKELKIKVANDKDLVSRLQPSDAQWAEFVISL